MRYTFIVMAVVTLSGRTPVSAQEPAPPVPDFAPVVAPVTAAQDMRIVHTEIHEQIGAVTRTELCHEGLAGAEGASTGMEVICAVIEIPPGSSMPKHLHHGLETAYVLDDATIQQIGRPQRKLAAGTVLIQPRDTPHDGDFLVVGDKPLRLYMVHVVDKDRPLFNFIGEPHPAPATQKAPVKKK